MPIKSIVKVNDTSDCRFNRIPLVLDPFEVVCEVRLYAFNDRISNYNHTSPQDQRSQNRRERPPVSAYVCVIVVGGLSRIGRITREIVMKGIATRGHNRVSEASPLATHLDEPTKLERQSSWMSL